jgi:hypothetical protein
MLTSIYSSSYRVEYLLDNLKTTDCL